MSPKEYIKLAAKTDDRPYKPVCDRLQEPGNAMFLHYTLGMVTEAGEIADIAKRCFQYGKEIDTTHVKEELGDELWYIARMLDLIGSSFEEVMEMNIKKLKARYGEKFSEEAALNRDLDKERATLEASEDERG